MKTIFSPLAIIAITLAATAQGVVAAPVDGRCAALQTEIIKIGSEFVSINNMRSSRELDRSGALPGTAYAYEAKKGALLDDASARIWELRGQSADIKCPAAAGFSF